MTTTQQLSDDLVSGKRPIAEHIHAIQSRLVNIALLICAAVAVPALIVSYYLAEVFGWKALFITQAGCAGFLWVATLRRRSWSLRMRIFVLLFIAFLLAVSGLLTRGLIGGDWFWFLFGTLLATVFLGLRYGMAYVAGTLVVMLLIGAGICFGHVTLAFDNSAYAVAPASWLLAAIGISFFLFAVLMPIGFLKRELTDTIAIVHQQALNLRNANERLQEEIRERERTEQRLRQSRERYALAEKAAKIGIWDWNILTGSLQWSDSIEPMFGFKPGEFPGTNEACHECIHPEDRKQVQDEVRATLDHGQEYNTEHRIVWPDGTIRWVLEKGDVYRDTDGRPLRMLGVVLDITERKRLEEALRENEERYRTLTEASPDSIYMFDTSGVFRFVNGPGARMVGRSPEEMIGLRQEDVFPPDQAQKHAASVQHVLDTGQPFVTEGWVSLSDGEHWFDTRIVPLKDAEGKPVAVLGISRNITERKLAEKRLQESQERYALAEKAAKIGVWDWDMLTGSLQWSDSIEPMFGFKPGEFAGTTDAFYECVHPEDRKHVQDAIQATLEHRVEYNTEHRIIRPDGTIRWVQDKGDVYRDEQGRPTRMIGVVLDITHRKFLEEALLESEERFRAIADYTYDWEEWIGPDGRPLWINPGGERLTGYTREECLAMPGYPLALVHEADRSLAEQYFREALVGKTGQNLPLRICCKDGSIVHTLVSWQPIYDRQGRFQGCRSSIHDVSELRRVEEDRARLREQLHQARKLEAVGQLASGIAHDFQNLLAVIKIHTDLLGREVAGQNAVLELLQVIREVVEQGKSMVQSLLTLSRSVPVEKTPVELMSVVKKFVAMFRTTLPASIELVAEFEPDNPLWICADASGIQQILMNLALNARDAMPEGGSLRIGVSGVSAEEVPDRPTTSASVGSWVRIVVSDTGQGIPPEIIPRLFEPFFSTKPRGEGTGLGLAVVNGIVEDHEGTIHVDSHVGHGTTFSVYLPQMESEEVSVEHPSATTPSTEPSGIILLAEDNWYLGNEIASLLRYTGHRVLRAEDGASLLEEANQNRGKVCLLIVDSDLPESGGYEVLRNLRATGDYTPAVLLTDPDETAEQPVPDDYTMLLHKPVAWEALIRLIEKVLPCDTNLPDRS